MSYTSDYLSAAKQSYLNATLDTQEALDGWKRHERIRSFFKFLAICFPIVGVLASLALWYWQRNAEGNRGLIIAGAVLGASLLLMVAAILLVCKMSGICKRSYAAYFKTGLYAQELSEHIKRKQLDPLLDHRIVISVRSILEAFIEYEHAPKKKRYRADDDLLLPPKKYRKRERELLSGPVSSAVVYIDGVEMGALNLGNEFSAFHVHSGAHTVRLKIRKDYPYYRKSVELFTPVTTVVINGGYHVLHYTLYTKLIRGALNYTLTSMEYDDVVTLLCEQYHTNHTDPLDKEAELSYALKQRAIKLYRELFPQEEPERIRLKERLLFGQEALTVNDLTKNLDGSLYEARLTSSMKVKAIK